MSQLPSFPAVSQSIDLPATAVVLASLTLPGVDGRPRMVRIVNEGPNLYFIAFGDSTVAATLPAATPGNNVSNPVPVGVTCLDIPIDATHVSTICRAAGTAVSTMSLTGAN